MDGSQQLKDDLRAGRIDADRLVDLITTMQQQLQAARQQLDAAQRRIAELEKLVPDAPPAKVDEPFSVQAEEKRQEKAGKKKRKPKNKKRRGRFDTADKLKQVERTEQVYPEGVAKNDCYLSHARPVWRLENGRAVLIAYEIYRGPKNQYGKIPGVLGRSEFALEIVVTIAQLVYIVGLSFDKVCLVLSFFQNLKLRKSQADSLLRQLSRHWENEFEVLCTLLANSLVVNTDETGWSLNSVWAFLSEKARVLLFGVHKDADTLKQLLDPDTFAGLVISDDAAVYAHFTAAQKCWAHLLRKAIKLTLQDPQNQEYGDFTDRLLAIYREACRVQRDGRLGDAGRARKVKDLEEKIYALCGPMWLANLPPQEGLANDFRLLVKELMRLMLAEELFTFVTAKPVKQPNGETKPVGATNNEAERTLRQPAEARKTGRTNKTLGGARRQTVLVSVLESLRLYLQTFTLSSVLAEIEQWTKAGKSCFTRLFEKLKLSHPSQPVLDQILPVPSG